MDSEQKGVIAIISITAITALLIMLASGVGDYLDYKVKLKAIEALKSNVELKLNFNDIKEVLK